MALRVAAEKAAAASKASPAVTLYRYITKQVPRVLTLYDIPMEPAEARTGRQYGAGGDAHAVEAEVHLVTLLEHGQALRQPTPLVDSVDQALEKFYAGVEDDEDEL
ncbi:hypothetical protein GQ600_19147 [Phytophthora cactorum]|nr:hypothetical protein GQ600_19147 [Phytophthora cactorum]